MRKQSQCRRRSEDHKKKMVVFCGERERIFGILRRAELTRSVVNAARVLEK
jgi:hypothetical protein